MHPHLTTISLSFLIVGALVAYAAPLSDGERTVGPVSMQERVGVVGPEISKIHPRGRLIPSVTTPHSSKLIQQQIDNGAARAKQLKKELDQTASLVKSLEQKAADARKKADLAQVKADKAQAKANALRTGAASATGKEKEKLSREAEKAQQGAKDAQTAADAAQNLAEDAQQKVDDVRRRTERMSEQSLENPYDSDATLVNM